MLPHEATLNQAACLSVRPVYRQLSALCENMKCRAGFQNTPMAQENKNFIMSIFTSFIYVYIHVGMNVGMYVCMPEVTCIPSLFLKLLSFWYKISHTQVTLATLR